MFLELMTLLAASDASSNSSRAASLAEQGLDAANSNRPSAGFLFFEEIDYTYEESGFLGINKTSTGKKLIKTSIPIGSIRSIVEIDVADWSVEEGYDLTRQRGRLKVFHSGPIVAILTYSKDTYYIDCSLVEFHQKLKS